MAMRKEIRMDLAISKREKVYLIIAGVLLLLFIIFIALNSDFVPISFIFFKIDCSISLALIVSFLIGIALGLALNIISKSKKQ